MKKMIWMAICCLTLGISMPMHAQAHHMKTLGVPTASNTEYPGLKIEKEGTGENVAGEYDNVLQVLVVGSTNDGKVFPVSGGAGFLIGKEDDRLQYLVTCNHILDTSEELKAKIRKKNGWEDNYNINLNIEIVVSKDVTVEGKIITASEEMDFAILQLGKALFDRQPFLLNDKPMSEYLRRDVSVIGYPSAPRFGDENQYFSKEDLQKNVGFLELEAKIKGQRYVQHHIFPNYGNIGGPIVDENNVVIALNQPCNDGKCFYALDIRQIISVCDSLGIEYKTIGMKEAELAEEKAIADRQRNKIIIIASCIGAAVLTIIIILIATRKKRKKKKEKKKEEMTVTEPAPNFQSNVHVNETSYKELLQAGNGQVQNNRIWNCVDEGDGQTVVLSTRNEQTLQAMNVNTPRVYLAQNDRNISVHKIPFTIGKDNERVDFCIANNTAVSRVHATILCQDGRYYIQDNHTTNGTFVNGKKIDAGVCVMIADQDQIKLANEEFIFRVAY